MKVFFFKSSDDGRDKLSGVAWKWPGIQLAEGGKIIPPARNGEWKRSGEWFCASPWWHHEASLTRRSQISGGDIDCYKWVEVGGCWACGCSICKHQCLELDASCNREPVQGDKERCDMGPFGFAEDQSCRCILNHWTQLINKASIIKIVAHLNSIQVQFPTCFIFIGIMIFQLKG